MQLYDEVGKSFWAELAPKEVSEPSLQAQLEFQRTTNAILLEDLERSQEYGAEINRRKEMLESEIAVLREELDMATLRIYNFEQGVQGWYSAIQHYEECLSQCADALGHVIPTLAGLQHNIIPVKVLHGNDPDPELYSPSTRSATTS
ncbi:hypothetical protein AbraIFM66951_012076, partial [Aspergillus brasiliensis]